MPCKKIGYELIPLSKTIGLVTMTLEQRNQSPALAIGWEQDDIMSLKGVARVQAIISSYKISEDSENVWLNSKSSKSAYTLRFKANTIYTSAYSQGMYRIILLVDLEQKGDKK